MILSIEQPGASTESYNGCNDSKQQLLWLEGDSFPLLLAVERRVCVGAARSYRPTASSG